jgi:signal transduction histidine kinase
MTQRRSLFDNAHAAGLQELGDVLDVGILVVDQELRVQGWNRWMERASGLPAADVLGRRFTDVAHGVSDASIAALRRATHGATVILSQRLHGHLLDLPATPGHHGGGPMQQSVRMLPLLDDADEPCGAAAIIEDVTERVVREDELRIALTHAQAANKAKSDFLAAMSHELRTPIGAMSGYADLLADGVFGPVTGVQHEQLDRIKTVARHLLGIVEEILTFARVEAGREEVHPCDVDAVQLARDAVVAVEPLLVKKGIEFIRYLPSHPVPMWTDPMKAGQILINLLGNAAKFTAHGTVSLTVDPSPDGSTVTFVISDTGPGIADADLGRIFEPFTQASKPFTRAHEGTGLGLTVSRELARLLGGDLIVRSEMGHGSTFIATLPAR